MLRPLLYTTCCTAAVGYPSWANPLLYTDTVEKTIFISSFQQDVKVMKSRYDLKTAKQQCNAEVTEVIEYDFSPRSLDLLKDPRNTIPYYSRMERQYHQDPSDLQISLRSVTVLSGASWVAIKSSGYLTVQNQAFFGIDLEFSPPSRGRVKVKIVLDIVNFLESRQDYNLIKWRPFGNNWEGPTGAFIANISIDVHLPWGSNSRDSHPVKHKLPPNKGFNIFTTLRDPLPDEDWSPTSVAVRYEYNLWTSEWETLPPQTLKIDLLFDQQQPRCNAFPYWIYLVSFGAALVFFAFFFSVVGFLYFEKPWITFLREDSLNARRYQLWKFREKKLEDEMR